MVAIRILVLTAMCAFVLAAGMQPANEPHHAQIAALEDIEPSSPARPVVVAAVEVGPFVETRELAGWVEAKATQIVRATRQGIVSAKLVANGQTVQAGDILLRLDDREARARIARHEALLARDWARYLQATVNLKRVGALHSGGAASALQLEQAQLELELCESDVAVRRTELALEELALEQSVIRAAIGGYVGSLSFETGSTIATTDELLTITALDKVLISIPIADRDFALLRAPSGPGWSAAIRVLDPSTSEVLASSSVELVASAMDARAGTLRAHAEIPNPGMRLWPGQFVRVVAELGPARQMNIVPPEALLSQSGDTAHVLVARQDGVAETRRVRIHGRGAGRVFIKEGLKPGENVIIEGQFAVADGQHINVDPKAIAIADAAAPVEHP